MNNRYRKFKTEFLPWAGFLFGLIATIIAVSAYLHTKANLEKAKEIEAQQYYYQVMDLLGAEAVKPDFFGVLLNPKSPGNFKAHKDKLGKARRLIEKIAILQPDDTNIHFLRFMYYVLLYDFESAKTELLKLQDPTAAVNDSNLYAFLGSTLATQFGQKERAFEFFEKAIELDPKNPSAYGMFGMMLHSAGRNDQSIANFKKAIELEPNNMDYRNGLGHVLFESGKLDEAEVALNQALNLDPESSAVHNTLGMLHEHKGNYDEAIKHLEKAIELSPTKGIHYYNLGLILRKKNKPKEARRAFNKAKQFGYRPIGEE